MTVNIIQWKIFDEHSLTYSTQKKKIKIKEKYKYDKIYDVIREMKINKKYLNKHQYLNACK